MIDITSLTIAKRALKIAESNKGGGSAASVDAASVADAIADMDATQASGVANVIRPSTIGDLTHWRVACIGDSLSKAGEWNTLLETALQARDARWQVTPYGVSSETSAQICARMRGGNITLPVRGVDTLATGANLVRVSPHNPVLADTQSLDWVRNAVPVPDSYAIRNRGVVVGHATRRTFFGLCDGSNQIKLLARRAWGSTDYDYPDSEVDIAEIDANTAITAEQSSDVGDADGTGEYSVKCTLDSSTGVHGRRFNVTYPAIFEVECWVYNPSVGGVTSITISTSGTSRAINDDAVLTTTVKDAWVRLHGQMLITSGGYLYIGYTSSGDESGKVYYVDNATCVQAWIQTGLVCGFKGNEPLYLRSVSTGSALPTGISAHRNYYVSTVSDTAIGLLTTSGGSAATYSGTGYCWVEVGHDFTFTFTPLGGTPTVDDSVDFAFSADPFYLDQHGIWVIWAGTNDSTTDGQILNTLNNIAEVVSQCKSGRYVILTPLPNTNYLGTRLHNYKAKYMPAQLEDRYPGRVVNTLSALQAESDSSADDIADLVRDYHPASLRSDGVHLNAAGNAVICEAVFSKLVALKWV